MPHLLAIDVSNAHTALALWPLAAGEDDEDGRHHWQIASDPSRTADEHRVLFGRLLADGGLSPADVGACVMSCVVPELLHTMTAACHTAFAVEPLVVGPGVRSGLRIRTENPRELGADRIANAVAALARHGAPVIVLDFATALTVDVVGADGDYLGAIIAPGIEVAADALARRTARLPRVDLAPPARAIGADTDAGLRSGVVFGYVGLVEGLVRRVHGEIGPAPVVATGEAPWLAPILAETKVVDAYEPRLTLDGLRRIYFRQRAIERGRASAR